MPISKIGKNLSHNVLLPLIISTPLLVGNAQKPKEAEPVKDPYYTELVSSPKTDKTDLQDKKEKENFNVWAFLLGVAATPVLTTGIVKTLKKNNENKVKQVFYKNHPTLNNFEEITGKKELRKFQKRKEPLYKYFNDLYNQACDGDFDIIDEEEYVKNVAKFTKYYPDRRTILLTGLKPFYDARLKPEEKTFLFRYLYERGLSTDEEWKWNFYNWDTYFLESAENYRELVTRLILMDTINDDKTPYYTNEADETEQAKETEEEKTQSYSPAYHGDVNFDSVGGQDKAINIIKKNILYPIKYPAGFKNTHLEHGFVMYGPPGTGKTLLAEAISNETKAHFIKVNGSELASKWVGGTEENWRNLFKEARENQPSIIFIDEFDGIASNRGKGDVHGDKALTQILGLLSDIKPDEKIFVIAATNRLDNIDPAFIRSGRLGTHIELKAPETERDVLNILSIHLKNQNTDKSVDLNNIANQLFRMNSTGADIAMIVNNAREISMERKHIYEKMENGTFKDSDMEELTITPEDFDNAIQQFKDSKFAKRKVGFNK